MPPLSLLSSMATRALLADLVAPGALPGLPAVQVTSLGGVEVARRIRAGEEADLVVLAARAIAALESDGLLVPGSARSLFRSEVVLAVPSDASRPDISTAPALREALASADRIGYSTGPSGDGLLALLDSWGIRADVTPSLVQAEPGVPVAQLLADRRVSVGIQQRSEFQGVPGVTVVGSLPAGCEIVTIFTGAVLSSSAEPDASAACLERLSAPDVEPTARRHGLELVDGHRSPADVDA